MIKIRLHGTPEEIKKAAKVIEGTFSVLNKSSEYSDRGESSYKRLYIEAEDQKGLRTLEDFKKELSARKNLIVSENSLYETYSAAFMAATAFFDHPVNLREVEEVIMEFSLSNFLKDDEISSVLIELLAELKRK